jgi:fumarate hydratase subunit beta
MTLRLTTPLTVTTVRTLTAGTPVLLSGTVYTARDAAHRRLMAELEAGRPLPIDLAGQALYYVGPAPAPPGRPIGSAGPTTSERMDPYTPRLLAVSGLRAMIGKGERSPAVVAAMREHGCVYLAATGGAGALIARCITACEVVWAADLGPEAVHRLTVRDLPVLVAIDCQGGNLYESGPAAFRTTPP